MTSIFIGMLLVLLNLNITVGVSCIELLPDFIGYWFIMKGLAECSAESARLELARPWAGGMVIYSGLIFGMNLLGSGASLGWIARMLSLISLGAILYISYYVVMGLVELEEKYQWELQTGALQKIFRIMALISIICFVWRWIGVFQLICSIVNNAAVIGYLLLFYRTKTQYAQCQKN
ncbi:MAG: hypothetical protein RSD28_07615 [Lachnospiraceae bacterium]